MRRRTTRLQDLETNLKEFFNPTLKKKTKARRKRRLSASNVRLTHKKQRNVEHEPASHGIRRRSQRLRSTGSTRLEEEQRVAVQQSAGEEEQAVVDKPTDQQQATVSGDEVDEDSARSPDSAVEIVPQDNNVLVRLPPTKNLSIPLRTRKTKTVQTRAKSKARGSAK